MRYQISENEVKWAQEIFALIEKKISAECDRLGSQMPYIPVDGHYQDMGGEHLTWWTNSFWAGILWQMYHAVGDKKYADSAIGLEERLDQALEDYQHLDHDLGFMWSHTAVAHYRLMKDEKAKLARGGDPCQPFSACGELFPGLEHAGGERCHCGLPDESAAALLGQPGERERFLEAACHGPCGHGAQGDFKAGRFQQPYCKI